MCIIGVQRGAAGVTQIFFYMQMCFINKIAAFAMTGVLVVVCFVVFSMKVKYLATNECVQI